MNDYLETFNCKITEPEFNPLPDNDTYLDEWFYQQYVDTIGESINTWWQKTFEYQELLFSSSHRAKMRNVTIKKSNYHKYLIPEIIK